MTNRQMFIRDIVEKYKKDYPEEYKNFLKLMEQRRAQMKDRDHARLQGVTEMRNAVSIPDKMANVVFYVLNGIDEPKFCEPKGETKWFVKKYPEFSLPNSY